MPSISLLSAKGSPGVTVAAAAFVAAAHDTDGPRDTAAAAGAVLVELDPSGGDLEILTGGRTGEPGLLHAAADLRRGVAPDVLAGHAVELAPGVWGLLSPAAAHAAAPVVEAVGAGLGAELSALGGWTVVDAGRWEPAQASAVRPAASDLVGVVCRSTAPSVAHARDLVAPLRRVVGRAAIVIVLVGGAPYGRDEVAEVFEVPVVGPLAWDPRGVSDLWATGATSRWLSRGLGRSARRVLDELVELVAVEPLPPLPPPPPPPPPPPGAWAPAPADRYQERAR